MLFGVTLIGIAALLWLARVSGSSAARRMTLKILFFHLGVGVLVSPFLPIFYLTRLIATILFAVLFIAYGLIWLFRPAEI